MVLDIACSLKLRFAVVNSKSLLAKDKHECSSFVVQGYKTGCTEKKIGRAQLSVVSDSSCLAPLAGFFLPYTRFFLCALRFFAQYRKPGARSQPRRVPHLIPVKCFFFLLTAVFVVKQQIRPLVSAARHPLPLFGSGPEQGES